jgi:hypothetical protein
MQALLGPATVGRQIPLVQVTLDSLSIKKKYKNKNKNKEITFAVI